MADKEAYLKQLEEQLAEIRSELEKLKARMETKTAGYEEVFRLERLEQQARHTLGKIREAGTDVWATLREQADKASEGLKDKIISLGKKLEAERESRQP